MKNAFVIMPFSTTASATEQQWTEIYVDVFKPAFEECGYACDRAQAMTGHLLDSIVERLATTAIVLADVTDRNPNVFYELGIRHSLKRGTIIVAQDSEVPSDLRGLWFLKYGLRPSEVRAFKQEIRRLITDIEAKPNRSDSAVSSYLDREDQIISSFFRRDCIKRLGALFTELSGNLYVLDHQIPGTVRSSFFSLGCLDLLCETLYIDVGPELLSEVYEVRNQLRIVAAGKVSGEQLRTTRDVVGQLAQKIVAIREKLSNGEFEEPTTVSMMIWESGGVQTDHLPYCAPDPPPPSDFLFGLQICPACGSSGSGGNKAGPGATCAVCGR